MSNLIKVQKNNYSFYLCRMNQDKLFMQRCLDLAKLGQGSVAPNPLVGAVIVHEGEIIGEGFHQKYGEEHAEVNAVNSVVDKDLLANSSIYVSLEPCYHFGKTPPCVDLLIKHQFKRVIIACQDSFQKVNGKGIEKLKKHGIEVKVGVLEEKAKYLNRRFFTFHQENRPYLILKWAQTSDGFIDKLRTKENPGINWISSRETKVLVHQWRSQEQAILVGRKTVENDNPSLTVREISGVNPVRIILDFNLKISLDAAVFKEDAPTIVLNSVKNESQNKISFVKVETTELKSILHTLYKLGIQSVLVEGGAATLQNFLDENLWDEARIIVGKSIFKQGLKAPIIQGVPNYSEKFSNDEIYYYFRG